MVKRKALEVKLKKLRPDARVPTYSHSGVFGDLGADLYSAEKTIIDPWTTVAVSTGIALEFPPEIGAVIEDRSGNALRGLTTLAGVVDPGYRGEIRVVMTNLSDNVLTIDVGERIAQFRLVNLIQANYVEVQELHHTKRGKRGFGSTGK